MIRREGRSIVVSGPVTLANVAGVLALMLAWMRDARARGGELAFANLPESLQTIARLYGVEGLLPVARAA